MNEKQFKTFLEDLLSLFENKEFTRIQKEKVEEFFKGEFFEEKK